MEIVAMLFVVGLAFMALGINVFLKMISPKGKVFPSCFKCGRPMVQLQHLGTDMPYQIKHYLNKYNLPAHVVRRFICLKGHRELWIAPPVGDQRKSIFVSH